MSKLFAAVGLFALATPAFAFCNTHTYCYYDAPCQEQLEYIDGQPVYLFVCTEYCETNSECDDEYPTFEDPYEDCDSIRNAARRLACYLEQ